MEELFRIAHHVLDCTDNYSKCLRNWVNGQCKSLEPWQIILATVLVTLSLVCIRNFLFKKGSLITRVKKTVFKIVRKLPYLKGYIEKEMAKTRKTIHEEIHSSDGGQIFLQELPKTGWSKSKILEESSQYLSMGTVHWEGGKASGTVYNYSNELVDITTEVFKRFSYSNPLHPDVFPGTRRMEAEIVRMACNMFNGGPQSCGVVTSGGTESILMACKAYRDRAYDKGIENPEMVAPITAHAAFDKAASLMGIRMVKIPVDSDTCQVNVNAMRKAINKNTCMLIGSAPQFPHGSIDPIEEISKLGQKYKVPVHVDGCLGGFLIAFMEKAGFTLPPFDFRLPGVTSISADTHKYGYTPKGTSVLLYSDPSIRQYQYFVTTDWPGGVYASPSIPGSRSGGIIATCWATMLHYGEQGYIDMTRKIINTTRKIQLGLKKIPNIYILGKPDVSVIAIGSRDFNVYRISDLLGKKGWNLSILQFPSSIHLTVTSMQTQEGIVEQFVKDVQEAVIEIMKDPKSDGDGKAALYGMAQRLPDRSMVAEFACAFLDACYSTDNQVQSGKKESKKKK